MEYIAMKCTILGTAAITWGLQLRVVFFEVIKVIWEIREAKRDGKPLVGFQKRDLVLAEVCVHSKYRPSCDARSRCSSPRCIHLTRYCKETWPRIVLREASCPQSKV